MFAEVGELPADHSECRPVPVVVVGFESGSARDENPVAADSGGENTRRQGDGRPDS
jgi:hypothetical protein